MAIELTARTLRALQEKNLKPNLIIQFDGLSTLFSSNPVQEVIRINDPGLFIDGTWFIGGLRPIEDNKVYVDSESTTFKTNQQMNYDEAKEKLLDIWRDTPDDARHRIKSETQRGHHGGKLQYCETKYLGVTMKNG